MRDDTAFEKLLAVLCELERKGIDYNLANSREDAIMVIAAAPGERWEIEFRTDGSIEFEKFISDGQIYGDEVLNEFLTRYAEDISHSVKMPQGDIESLTSKMK